MRINVPLCILGALLVTCSGLGTPPPTATVVQTLEVTLWVEWPVVPAGSEQIAHVIVTDRQGIRISRATVQGKLVLPDGSTQTLMFPVTGADGHTQLSFPIPVAGDTAQMIYVDVTSRSRYGNAYMEFVALP